MSRTLSLKSRTEKNFGFSILKLLIQCLKFWNDRFCNIFLWSLGKRQPSCMREPLWLLHTTVLTRTPTVLFPTAWISLTDFYNYLMRKKNCIFWTKNNFIFKFAVNKIYVLMVLPQKDCWKLEDKDWIQC